MIITGIMLAIFGAALLLSSGALFAGVVKEYDKYGETKLTHIAVMMGVAITFALLGIVFIIVGLSVYTPPRLQVVP